MIYSIKMPVSGNQKHATNGHHRTLLCPDTEALVSGILLRNQLTTYKSEANVAAFVKNHNYCKNRCLTCKLIKFIRQTNKLVGVVGALY